MHHKHQLPDFMCQVIIKLLDTNRKLALWHKQPWPNTFVPWISDACRNSAEHMTQPALLQQILIMLCLSR